MLEGEAADEKGVAGWGRHEHDQQEEMRQQHSVGVGLGWWPPLMSSRCSRSAAAALLGHMETGVGFRNPQSIPLVTA